MTSSRSASTHPCRRRARVQPPGVGCVQRLGSSAIDDPNGPVGSKGGEEFVETDGSTDSGPWPAISRGLLLSSCRAAVAFFAWRLRHRPRVHRVRTDDIEIRCHDYGRVGDLGTPVLLLHGGFGVAESWLGQIPALAAGRRVLVPDSRGHGRTTLGKRSITYRGMGTDAADLLDSLGVGAAHVVGWSDGGCSAIGLALQRPDLVRSLALLGTPAHADDYTPAARRSLEAFVRPEGATMRVIRLVHRAMSGRPEDWAPFLEQLTQVWLTSPDYTSEELARITAPALVLGAEYDEFLSLWPGDPLRVFRACADRLPAGLLEVVPEATHLLPFARAGEVNRRLLAFFETVESAGSS
jgi:pimeloyl-ACP methyl ester carboxylesterase